MLARSSLVLCAAADESIAVVGIELDEVKMQEDRIERKRIQTLLGALPRGTCQMQLIAAASQRRTRGSNRKKRSSSGGSRRFLASSKRRRRAHDLVLEFVLLQRAHNGELTG